MDKFHVMVSKHGEQGAQALLENWERSVGIGYNTSLTLEQRWDRFLCVTDNELLQTAA